MIFKISVNWLGKDITEHFTEESVHLKKRTENLSKGNDQIFHIPKSARCFSCPHYPIGHVHTDIQIQNESVGNNAKLNKNYFKYTRSIIIIYERRLRIN